MAKQPTPAQLAARAKMKRMMSAHIRRNQEIKETTISARRERTAGDRQYERNEQAGYTGLLVHENDV